MNADAPAAAEPAAHGSRSRGSPLATDDAAQYVDANSSATPHDVQPVQVKDVAYHSEPSAEAVDAASSKPSGKSTAPTVLTANPIETVPPQAALSPKVELSSAEAEVSYSHNAAAAAAAAAVTADSTTTTVKSSTAPAPKGTKKRVG
jgi:hypothetical protein